MTMPHLMNCEHMDDGWCIQCVKKLWNENEELMLKVDKLPVSADGVRLFPGDIVWFVDNDGLLLDYDVIGVDQTGVIDAWPRWAPNQHVWPDDIDGIMPDRCFVSVEKANEFAEQFRKAT